MNDGLYKAVLVLLGLGFAVAFAVICLPPLIANPDILGALGQGFVNPYSTGYSLDVLTCWAVLAVFVLWERQTLGIRHGWIALALGVAPGVATGFAFYLLLRAHALRGRA
ncbi:DUF2834 domain-containing protein [Zavarzinia aquatilis]|uniref:DUF2834 domain-containing protein n=1 Tax=Zavarzinia aquatilis TaxID=2211142 RepID=A0A317EL91_9PROT|nr:DUF2834 domain-containing protein [Zavarzinia aquatilis]PWR25985.1 hypothetical protein DKG74_03290 [Zavarzinia aquatilis]